MGMKVLVKPWGNGKRSVPQIFINNEHIGGCDDLYALDGEKKLDNLLAKCGTI